MFRKSADPYIHCDTGDEGGPVIRAGVDASQDVQVGIALAVDVCGELGKPSIFTTVAHLDDWIEGVIRASSG